MSKKKRCSSGQNFVAPRLIWIGFRIDEMLRRLDDANSRIAKQRHGAFQELRSRHEIGVEDRDEFRDVGQRSDMFSAWLRLPALAFALSDRER